MFLPDGQKAPSAKRCIKTGQVFSHLGRNLCEVRKHRAPKGALRLAADGGVYMFLPDGQKAPSAKRCIKTGQVFSHLGRNLCEVRKHRAPKGALRQREPRPSGGSGFPVRKHRAPKGALRLIDVLTGVVDPDVSENTERQKVH